MATANAPLTTCQACGSGDLHHFFEVRDIPVHSTLLIDDPARARGYPKGDLKLGFCRACGFIENVWFDPTVHEYSTRCEESQGFSPRFNQFLHDLTARLIDRHGVRDKTVLEIGCGKGDFLELICRLGGNRGIGIDPGIIPERQGQSEAAGRIQFIQDFFSEQYAHLTGDFVACRHTLEHIQPVQDFVKIVRRALASRPDTVVFFELPDVERELQEIAFWDIYYEHCSYFTLGSLARLFRSCGFEILNLEKDFADQYLVIEARPTAAAQPVGKVFPSEDDLGRLTDLVGHFERECRRTLDGWKDRISTYHRQGKKTVVWGSSSKGVSFLTTLGLKDEIGYVVDINVYRQGKFMPGAGHEIVAPERLRDYRPDVVLVMNPIYCQEIGGTLSSMGLSPEIVPA